MRIALSEFAPDLLADLQQRIENLKISRATVQSELEDATSQCNEPLQHVLRSQLEETENDLRRFEKEFYTYQLQEQIEGLESAHATAKSDLKSAVSQGDLTLQHDGRSKLKIIEKDLKRCKKKLRHIESPGLFSESMYALKLWMGKD